MSIFWPIERVAETITFSWLDLTKGSYVGDTVHFFIYDLIKIGLLLVVINYVMAVTRYYFPIERVRDILSGRNWYGLDYFVAALLGVVTPFCSCSSIPLFIGFLSAGIPLGVTFSFLISSPLVNEASLYLFPAIFGLRTTLIYNVVGIVVAILGGVLIRKLKMEKYIQPEFLKFRSKEQVETKNKEKKVPLKDLLKLWSEEAGEITKKVFPYIVLGVAIGALIHGLVPETTISSYLSEGSWWTVPAAVILGTPLYANSVGVVPIVEALVGKGVPMGTALSFMTATVTISVPEGLMLSKLMKRRLLFTFFGITIVGIIFMGYLFNTLM